MRSSGLALGTVLGLLLALSGGPNLSGQIGGANPAAAAAPDPVSLTGVVVNAVTGAPVPRALVQIGPHSVLTDHGGKFQIAQFTETGGMVQVTKPGYYFSLDSNNNGGIYISGSRLRDPMHLRLYPEALLTGTVTAAGDGEPLRQVQVSAMRSFFDEYSHRWVPAAQTQTNARGEFRLPVAAGQYRIETQYQVRNSDVLMPVAVPAISSGNTSDVIRIHSGEEQHFDLRPSKERPYTVLATLEPAAGYAIVSARMANGPRFQVAALRAPESGIYKLELPTGTFALSATRYGPQGPEFAETTVTVANHDVSGVVLRFAPLQTLPVEVQVDPSTSDNATAPVMRPGPSSLGLMLRNVDSNADQNVAGAFPSLQKDGTFAFHASPGHYRLQTRNFGNWFVESATYGGLDLLRQEMVVAPDAGGLPLELTISNRTGTLTGMATVKGVPENCMIYLVPTTPSTTPVITMMSNGTRGFVWNLPPGTYQAVAFERRHAADWSDPAALAPFASHVRTVTIHAGDKATLDLDAVTEEEEVVP